MLSAVKEVADTGISDLQIALVAGVLALIGAVLGFMASTLSSKADRKRADRWRWDDQILADALELLELSDWLRGHALADSREDGYGAIANQRPEKAAQFRDIHDRLQLIASRNINEAAERLLSRTLNFGEQRTGADIKLGREALLDARDGFKEAVRKELNARD